MAQADFNFTPTDEQLASFFINFDHKNFATSGDPFLDKLFTDGYNEGHKWVTIQFDNQQMFAFIMDVRMFYNPVTEEGMMFSIEEDAFMMLYIYFSAIHSFYGKGSLYCDEMLQFIHLKGLNRFLTVLYDELRERYGSEDEEIHFHEAWFI